MHAGCAKHTWFIEAKLVHCSILQFQPLEKIEFNPLIYCTILMAYFSMQFHPFDPSIQININSSWKLSRPTRLQ